jgi:signal transduction histidine kinase
LEVLPHQAAPTPTIVMHIQRMLLEALTNTLKHANARNTTMPAHHDAEERKVEIILSDNGTGWDNPGAPSGGQGLASMRARANAIGARIQRRAVARRWNFNPLGPGNGSGATGVS